MEDVLDVYELPYDPMRPGDNQKIDSEYKRNGTCSIFAFVEPLGGKHHVSVHEHRTAIDWAIEIKYLSDEMYPDAEKIILVMDNLNKMCIRDSFIGEVFLHIDGFLLLHNLI